MIIKIIILLLQAFALFNLIGEDNLFLAFISVQLAMVLVIIFGYKGILPEITALTEQGGKRK